jgi:hypothetical protein
MKYLYIIIILVFSSHISCRQEKTPMQMIYGKWKGQKWLVEGKPMGGFDVSVINFEFKPDSNYIARFGMQDEEGTFNLNNNTFNAHSIYGSNKKCPILKLTQDTMIWMMDSVHQSGNLYLVRVKE